MKDSIKKERTVSMPSPIRIVAIGDSMTETSGEHCPALTAELARVFPDTPCEVINQGVGSTRVGHGLWRLTHPYLYQDKEMPALITLNPDIVLLESFAYNNGSDGTHDECLQHFRDMHEKIVKTLHEHTHALIVFVVAIAPDLGHFLNPVPNFVHTPTPILRRMAEDRILYLEEGIQLAQDLNLPLANVYQASLDAEKNGFPRSTFINPEDGIHPGPEGHQLAARIITATLKQFQMIPLPLNEFKK